VSDLGHSRNESGGSGEFSEAETGKAVEPESGRREAVNRKQAVIRLLLKVGPVNH